MVENRTLVLPTEQELQNQSKSDGLTKTLVLLQTLWFVAQCIARRVENLPMTELEIVTLAYIAVYLGIFIAWWDKPHNVDCPIRVFQKPAKPDPVKEAKNRVDYVLKFMIGLHDDTVNLRDHKKVPMFYSGRPEKGVTDRAGGITLAIAVAFGAIHCAAWSFPFSSDIEASLWRLSCVVITSVPILLIGAHRLGDSTLPLLVLIYVVARFTTLVLAFVDLSSLSPATFQAVPWTTLLPHL